MWWSVCFISWEFSLFLNHSNSFPLSPSSAKCSSSDTSLCLTSWTFVPDVNSSRSVEFTFSALRCLFRAQIPLFPNHPASYPRRSQVYGSPGIRSWPGSKGLCLSFISPFLPLNNIKDISFSYNVLFREFSVLISFSNMGFGFLVSKTRSTMRKWWVPHPSWSHLPSHWQLF